MGKRYARYRSSDKLKSTVLSRECFETICADSTLPSVQLMHLTKFVSLSFDGVSHERYLESFPLNSAMRWLDEGKLVYHTNG